MWHNIIRIQRFLIGLIACSAVTTLIAVPAAAAPSPYPDIANYEGVGGLQKFTVVDRDGLWFASPIGQRCGIGDDGSYGCSGPIPGMQQGENEIAWLPGDPGPRVYHADKPRFDSGTRQQIITVKHRMTYRGSTCAVTVVGTVYCIHGENADSQLMLTAKAAYVGSQASPVG